MPSPSCTQCGKPAARGASYCAYCGAALNPSTTTYSSSNAPSHTRKSVFAFLGAFAAVVWVLVLVSGTSESTNPPKVDARKAIMDTYDPPSSTQLSPKEHLQRAQELVQKMNPNLYEDSDVLVSLITKHVNEAKKNDAKLDTQAASVMKRMAAKVTEAVQYKSWNSLGTEVSAQLLCKTAIELSLKAPSTAEWGNESVGRWKDHPGFFIVDYTVDAQNSFGAKLRSTFECQVRCFTENSCEVKKLYQR